MKKHEEPAAPARELGRNERCHCGSGKKYKQCCLAADEQAARSSRAEAAEAEAAAAEAAESADDEAAEPAERKRKSQRPRDDQPWKRSSQGARGAPQRSLPRKVGGGS